MFDPRFLLPAKLFAVTELDDERLLYDADAGVIHLLNPTASLIWSLCDGRHGVAEMSAAREAPVRRAARLRSGRASARGAGRTGGPQSARGAARLSCGRAWRGVYSETWPPVINLHPRPRMRRPGSCLAVVENSL